MENPPAPAKRMRRQAYAMLALAVVVGIMVGVAGEHLRMSQRAPDRREFRREQDLLPPPWEDIGLSDAQRAQIEQILHSRRERTDSIMRQVLPQIRFHVDDVRSEIAQILTPEQLQQLDEAFSSMHRRGDSVGWRWGRRGGRRRGPPGGGPPRLPN
jgi:Spy/CpxP family protein refolding chaperone